jgi:hypothetical protein
MLRVLSLDFGRELLPVVYAVLNGAEQLANDVLALCLIRQTFAALLLSTKPHTSVCIFVLARPSDWFLFHYRYTPI